MQLTKEQKQIGKDNFNDAVASTRKGEKRFEEAQGLSRRSFLKGAAAAVPGLGAAYFGYQKLAEKDRVKVAFIGTGDEGGVLLNEHPSDYMKIVAIADMRPSNRLRAFEGDGNDVRMGLKRKLGEKAASEIKSYHTYQEMLEKEGDNIQAVVIAVPLIAHAPIALDCLKAGKHVLTEKLMAYNIGQCKEMIKVAREQKLLLAVGHQRHYSVLYDNANFLVQQGVLGDVKFIRAQWHRNNTWPGRDSWNKPIPGLDAKQLTEEVVKKHGYESLEELCHWRLYHRTGGGLMAELGSHQLDAASIFLGKVKPLAVQGFGGRNFFGVKGLGTDEQQADKRESDDHVYTTFEFPGPHHSKGNRTGDGPTDDRDVVVVTYSSINHNQLEPYGETLLGSRGTLMVHKEQETLLFKENGPTGGGGVEQRLVVLENKTGGAALAASESLAPSTQASSTANAIGQKISRGYTEEMEHFCYAVANAGDFLNRSPKDGGLRCNGTVAMGDAIMALTSNLAMKHHKRVEFRDEWFDPTHDATPEKDVTG